MPDDGININADHLPVRLHLHGVLRSLGDRLGDFAIERLEKGDTVFNDMIVSADVSRETTLPTGEKVFLTVYLTPAKEGDDDSECDDTGLE